MIQLINPNIKFKLTHNKSVPLNSIDNLPIGICQATLNDSLSIIYGNKAFYNMYECSQLQITTLTEIICSSYIPKLKSLAQEAGKYPCKIFEMEAPSKIRNSSISWLLLKINYDLPSDYLNCVILDVTKQHEVELKYAREEQYRSLLLANTIASYEINLSLDEIMTLNNSYFNQPAEPLVSYSEMIKSLCHNSVYHEDQDIFLNTYCTKSLIAKFNQGIKEVNLEYRTVNQDKQVTWMNTTIHMTYDYFTKQIKAFAYIKNINDRKIKELMLQYKAERDMLTTLYNRHTTERMINDFLNAEGKDGRHAFFIMDLDNFKSINDNLGHVAGDKVLLGIAQIIKKIFRQSDIVGRIGGDEYIIFLKNVCSQSYAAMKAAEIRKSFKEFAPLDDNAWQISGTLGIAMYPQHGSNFEQLYQKADAALYYAKGLGKDCFAIYNKVVEQTCGEKQIDCPVNN